MNEKFSFTLSKEEYKKHKDGKKFSLKLNGIRKINTYQEIGEEFGYSWETVRKITQNSWKIKHEKRNISNKGTRYSRGYTYTNSLVFCLFKYDEYERKKNRKKEKIKTANKAMKFCKKQIEISTILKDPKLRNLSLKMLVIILREREVEISLSTLYYQYHNGRYLLEPKMFARLIKGPYKSKKYWNTKKKVPKRWNFTPYSQMPEHFKKPLERGHLQVDIVEGTKFNSHVIATAIDVYTREFYFWIIPSKTALNFKKAMLIIIEKFGYKIKSILCDNGSENYAFKDEEFKDIQIFSCNPYASYQKALIEQKHNQLRRYFKKHRKIKMLSEAKIFEIADLINYETYLINKNARQRMNKTKILEFKQEFEFYLSNLLISKNLLKQSK